MPLNIYCHYLIGIKIIYWNYFLKKVHQELTRRGAKLEMLKRSEIGATKGEVEQ